MKVHDISELILVKNKTYAIEEKIENIIRNISKKHKIDFARCKDYGQRHFNMTITFDQLNIEAFDDNKIQELKKLYSEYVELRKKTRPLETQYDAGMKVANDIKSNMDKYNG